MYNKTILLKLNFKIIFILIVLITKNNFEFIFDLKLLAKNFLILVVIN